MREQQAVLSSARNVFKGAVADLFMCAARKIAAALALVNRRRKAKD
jgi:hypothetical protein